MLFLSQSRRSFSPLLGLLWLVIAKGASGDPTAEVREQRKLPPARELCHTMPSFPVPAIAAAGLKGERVEFSIHGVVQDGRVVQTKLTTNRAPQDRCAYRALVAEVHQIMREGYRCRGDGEFEQYFIVRLDD